ncbi:hypothetical protein [Emticicia sp. BO119]|uniref:hypothetical protein n=1 Tax=Emticicia sp. BO119 TaxID=2757768 RepID=UPI0015F0DB89|nr:hypothetical protein [Emticicia sp. BO119]MBA4851451.1 hypothetical protein [Emticicia sp. BO119]
MKEIVLLLLAFLQLSCIDTKQLFTIKEEYPAYEIKATHKKVAVLPVNYVADSDSKDAVEKLIDGNTDPFVRQEQKAYKFQHIIYEELYRVNKKTDWLDDKLTNQLLKEKNISIQDIGQLSKPEIAKALQVDAVIYLDFFFKTETINTADKKSVLRANEGKKYVVDLTVEIYSSITNDIVWKGKSTVDRQKIYSPTLFRDLIAHQLEPVLPFN